MVTTKGATHDEIEAIASADPAGHDDLLRMGSGFSR